ncbi:zinc finger protein PLAG1-like [Planococcus citri]|uniref:zinc finger protein PLAG1-like n=1 Tax=Planococcus citri TaxID=170843 RepID=UPI0031F85DE6
MVSKLPTDLFPSPDRESQNLSLGGEGRQLRSRLVELCSLCQKPIPASTGKTHASHIHCTCITPPNTTVPDHNLQMSPKKTKRVVDTELGESSKRQLFKESVPLEVVDEKSDSAKKLQSLPPSNICKSDTKSTSTKDSASASSKKADSSSSKSRHVCNTCSKSFNTPGKLNQHMYSHTGEKPFVCSHCSKAFSSKFKLVRHILIHSDLRQYRCTICEKTFHRKDHLKNHSKVHSPVKRRFKCDREDCNKEYSSILSYRKHIAVHSAEEGNLECKICGKKFETKEDTLFHLKVHAGSRSLKTPADRKYHCDHCDRSFFTGKDVRRHLVVHTGRRDFLCQYCPQRFGRKDHLTRHIKKSHSSSSKKVKTRKTQDVDRTKSVDNRHIAMPDEKPPCDEFTFPKLTATATVTAEKQDQSCVSSNENMYKMPNISNPPSTTSMLKLESSPDVLSIVTIDDKTPMPSTKVEDIYNILDPNIPFKYPNFEFDQFTYPTSDVEALAGPSTSHHSAILPDLMYPPPSYQADLNFPMSSDDIKVESDLGSDPLSMDLVLPPITNISPSIPSMGNCILSNADIQDILSSNAGSSCAESTDDGSRIGDQTFNFLPNAEILNSLLNSSDPQTNSTPLPGFSQAFHQPP